MQVILNSKAEIVEKEMNVVDFLLLKGLNLETVIVEYNEKIIKKDAWLSVMLQNNDRLEVLKFVGGG